MTVELPVQEAKRGEMATAKLGPDSRGYSMRANSWFGKSRRSAILHVPWSLFRDFMQLQKRWVRLPDT